VAKRKLSPTVTLNTLHLNLKHTKKNLWDEKKPLEYPKDNTKLNPVKHLLEFKTWWIKWKRVINKIVEWVAWWWANAKMDEESLFIMKQNVSISKDDITRRKTPFFNYVFIQLLFSYHLYLQTSLSTTKWFLQLKNDIVNEFPK